VGGIGKLGRGKECKLGYGRIKEIWYNFEQFKMESKIKGVEKIWNLGKNFYIRNSGDLGKGERTETKY